MALTPKIPWDQKLVDCCLGSLCEEKYIFSNSVDEVLGEGFPQKNFEGLWSSSSSPVASGHISETLCTHGAHVWGHLYPGRTFSSQAAASQALEATLALGAAPEAGLRRIVQLWECAAMCEVHSRLW
jgi:hypothetical protein